jgi:hypothetical protein
VVRSPAARPWLSRSRPTTTPAASARAVRGRQSRHNAYQFKTAFNLNFPSRNRMGAVGQRNIFVQARFGRQCRCWRAHGFAVWDESETGGLLTQAARKPNQ